MMWQRGNAIISVEQIDGFGKNAGLWIGTRKPNQFVKVASFGNNHKAMLFRKWFEYLLGLSDEEVEWESDGGILDE